MESSGPVSPPAAPVPGRRSVVPMILLAGIAVGLVIVGVILWQFLTRPADAEDVARDFLVATYEGDVAQVCALSTSAFIEPILERHDVDDCAGLVEALQDDPSVDTSQEAADIEVLESTVDGDHATVRLTDPAGMAGVWTEAELERIDDEWLVTDFSG